MIYVGCSFIEFGSNLIKVLENKVKKCLLSISYYSPVRLEINKCIRNNDSGSNIYVFGSSVSTTLAFSTNIARECAFFILKTFKITSYSSSIMCLFFRRRTRRLTRSSFPVTSSTAFPQIPSSPCTRRPTRPSVPTPRRSPSLRKTWPRRGGTPRRSPWRPGRQGLPRPRRSSSPRLRPRRSEYGRRGPVTSVHCMRPAVGVECQHHLCSRYDGSWTSWLLSYREDSSGL